MSDEQQQSKSDSTIQLAMSGRKLSSSEAANLEKLLANDPLNLDSRIQLLGYYAHGKYKDPELKIARIKHILWIVENSPQDSAGLVVEMHISRGLDRFRDYVSIRNQWKTQIDSNQDNPDVLRNAASFFILNEIDIAERCLLRAKELEPENRIWYHELSHLYKLWGTGFEKQALAECERSLELASTPFDQYQDLVALPELAFNASEYEKSAAAANRVIEHAEMNKAHFYYAMAIQAVHTTLGRIALRNNDIEEANKHLILALPEKKPDTRVFLEPDRHLVAELYAAGERESVLKWLDLCSQFLGTEKWREQLAQGQSPWTYLLPERDRFFNLSRLPRSAFNSGRLHMAKNAAEEFFQLADLFVDEWRHKGFGLHTAHVVLGQLALKSGDLSKAKDHLEHAGNVPEADRLALQGPDFNLAADLLKLGHTDLVLHFLKQCDRLWAKHPDKFLLSEWANEISSGKVPYEWL